ncbi:MAG: ferrous iron transport protein B, partial [Deltaproteobacteria bacterium]|nr:ferrous iron transport protein B [Deltaproteobacteria bacterium]
MNNLSGEKPQNSHPVSGSGKKTITVAVAGNPNTGKSTLVNGLAGTRLQVGNWPGVTVEKKSAVFEYSDRKIELIDLPGTYSLSPYTQEEIIAGDYLVHEKPDVIIDVMDATNLERNLYLTVQLSELQIPMVVALNIYDEAVEKGYTIDINEMEKTLGAPVIATVATKKTGLEDLLKSVILTAENPQPLDRKPLYYSQDIESAAALIKTRLDQISLSENYPPRWLALKILEGDRNYTSEIKSEDHQQLISKTINHLQTAYDSDMESIMAEARYALAADITRDVLRKTKPAKTELTDKIDKVVLSRYWGIPIFLAAMWLLFKLTFDVSKPFADWVNSLMAGPFKVWAGAFMGLIGAPDLTTALVTDGIIAGVGAVLGFVPVIFAMMFFITFLEGSGYMARAAFVMDRVMQSMGLHGKSFIPLLLGFGCNVPGIYATRTLENPQDKILTVLLLPLMSCGARLPVYVIFIGAFFPTYAGTVLWTLYVLGIVLAIFMGIIFKRTLFRGEAPMFVMELPPYRMPSFKSLMGQTWEKGKHFIIKAGTYILAVSVLVWFLLNLPWGVENKKDSYLGRIGQVAAPVLEPIGFGRWEASSSLISGVIAKETIIGT